MSETWMENSKRIDSAGPELLRILGAVLKKIQILSQLLQAGVLQDYEKETLEDIADRQERANQFLTWLKTGSPEKYDAFLNVMWDIGETQVIRCLGHMIEPKVQQPRSQQPQAQQPRSQQPQAQQPQDQQPVTAVGTVDQSERPVRLWDRDHPDGQGMLIDVPDLQRKLTFALPDLKKTVKTKELWSYLGRYEVMDDDYQERCQVGTTGDQVEGIIRFLKADTVWKTHAFFKSLAETGQAPVIDFVLGQGAKDAYTD